MKSPRKGPRSEISPPQDPRAFLVLAGHQEKGKHVVLLGDATVLLPALRFEALVDLVVARLATRTGRSAIPSAGQDPYRTRLIVHRLRADIDGALARGSAKNLIKSVGARTEYFLDLERSAVAIAGSFFELGVGNLSPDIVKEIRRLSRMKWR